MLKHLAVLALLLTLLPKPIPGQTATSAGNGGGSVQSQGEKKKGDSVPTSTSINPIQAQAANKHADEVSKENTEEQVKLTSLPPITVTDRKKTWLDHFYNWGPWVFTGLLVIVGFLQVKTMIRQADLLSGTLTEIKTQAEHMASQVEEMKGQSSILGKSVAAAQASANAANDNLELIIKERRAHIRIECDDISFANRSPLTDGVSYRVVFYGPTVAFILNSAAQASISSSKSPPAGTIFGGMRLPKIISPGAEPIPQNAWFYKRLSDGEIAQIEGGQCFIHLNGFIQYRDVFERERWAYVNKVWQ
jgi:hypothetical protein